MTRQKKPAGRPKTTGKGTLIGIRLHDPDLEELDAWCEREGASRQEAIRLFIRLGLGASRPGKKAPYRTH
jgi:metal-responsive CopG/Arc/MetJ family transcriptional regulator